MGAYEGLLNQVEEFIRRFYVNRLIRGSFITVGIVLFLFLLFTNLEYFLTFNTTVRSILFFTLALCTVGLVWFYIIDPILKLSRLRKRMSTEEAAVLIGRLMPDVSDRVLNTLQLSSSNQTDLSNRAFIEAAINQKAVQLASFSFGAVIDFKENWKYGRYVLLFFVVLFGLLFLNPQIILQGSERIVKYNQEFIMPAPFQFSVVDLVDKLEEGSDLELTVRLSGYDLPEKVFVQSNYGRFMMLRTGANVFQFTIPKVKSDVGFYLDANGYKSGSYQVQVFGSSRLSNFKIQLNYPNYTGKPVETILNPVNVLVPEGTKVEFLGQLSNVKQGVFSFVDSNYRFTSAVAFSRVFNDSETYKIRLKNDFGGGDVEFDKQIEVIKDAFPRIDVKESIDSTNNLLRFFDGSVNDDYGVTAVYFVSEKSHFNEKLKPVRVRIPGVGITGGRFYHMLDLRAIDLKAGDEIVYYFEVFDNDGVNGPKRSISNRFVYQVPKSEELQEKRMEALSGAQSSISDLMRQMEEFQKSMEEFRKANLDKRMDSWKKKDMLDRLMKQQSAIQENLKHAQDELKNSMEEKALFDEVDEELLKKQELLEELMEELMDDEMKGLLDELQKLMEQQDNNSIEEKMKDMDLSKEEMSRQMDRTLEMLKRMEVEEKFNDLMNKLDALQDKQESLSKELGVDEKEMQQELNSAFDELTKELDELKEKNEQLKKPYDLDEEKDLKDGINEEMNKASQALDKGKDEKANDNQKGAADKMKEMKESLQAQMDAQKKKQKGEDMESLRALLENLMRLSFEQEDLMAAVRAVNPQDPLVNKLNRRQRKLMDDHVVVKDSLVALSERVPQISALVDAELKTIDRNFLDLTSFMHDRELNKLMVNQQFVMTSYNNLALMLNEALEQMQQQMQNMMPGSGECDNPGGTGSKPSEGMGDMKEMLKKQLERMKQQGPNPGGDQPGDQPGVGQPGGEGTMGLPGLSSKELAKMAAEQAAMRKMLEKLRQELNKDGKGSGNALNPLIEELERQEKDLVYRNDRNLIQRQQEILTRLLESEKALQEREWDDKRQNETAKNNENRNLIEFLEYKKRKEREIELLRSKTPRLNNYYRQKAVEFFNIILSDD